MSGKKRQLSKETGEGELEGQLVRALADYDNLRKRSEAEKEFWIKFAGERIIIKLLPILDMLESSLKHLNDQGLGIALSEFKKIFTEEGLEEIKPQRGEVFDPQLHEAIESVEGGSRGKISELVLSGWKFKEGKVVRFARVKVYGKKGKKDLERNDIREDHI